MTRTTRIVACAALFVALSCSNPNASGSADAQTPVAPTVAANSDWRNSTGVFGLSFRQFGWDHMSRVRPESVSDQFSLEIMSADKVPLFCHVQEQSAPTGLRPAQAMLSRRVQGLADRYPEGSIQQDRLGGSKVLSSRVVNVGEVAVVRVVQETLDRERPILRQELVQFAVSEEHGYRYVMIECFVGYGSPLERHGEIAKVVDSLQINGVSLGAR